MSDPMRLSRHMTLWECEGEHESTGAHSIALWETLRLNVEVPPTAVPYCCYTHSVVFYTDCTLREAITKCDYYNLAAAPSPHLLWVDGRWWERAGAEVVYRDGKWYAKHEASDNTRAARWANRETEP